MEVDKLKEIAKTILSNATDAAAVSEHLTAITEDNAAQVGQIATLTEQNKKLTEDNETLRKVNMGLFLKVGEQKPTFPDGEETGAPGGKEKPLEYGALFDEKGKLK